MVLYLLTAENFDQATTDYQLALDIKMKHLPEMYRELSEVYFKLGLSLEYGEHYESAIERIESAMDCLNKRMASLSESEVEQKEKAVIKEFLSEMEVKVSFTNLDSRHQGNPGKGVRKRDGRCVKFCCDLIQSQ